MKRLMLCFCVAVLGIGWALSSVSGRPPYKKAFDEKYTKKIPALTEPVEQAKCLVCHGKNAQGKEDKKVRNSYGRAIEKLIAKNEKENDKIVQALEKVAAEVSDPANPISPTFGDLIKQGKLPGAK